MTASGAPPCGMAAALRGLSFRVSPPRMRSACPVVLVNPTGRFVMGGPHAIAMAVDPGGDTAMEERSTGWVGCDPQGEGDVRDSGRPF
ncbi:MAG: hypothetical protein OXG35_33095 [Acidobacteria bacterium]|nr:hypothetical protein [Acidobacteriota bacterium]